MSDYGVTPTGEFNRKDLTTIQEDLLRRAEEKFPHFNPAPGSPDRQRIDFVSIELVDQWEALEAAFDASYLDTAHDIQLDRLLGLVGVGRIPRRGATGEVEFSVPGGQTADEEITIPQGTLVSTQKTTDSPAIVFKTTETASISKGSAIVSRVGIVAVEPFTDAASDLSEEYLGSETNVPADSITKFVETVSGVANVTNLVPTGQTGTRDDGTEYDFVSGRDRETDAELRRRYKNSLGLNAKASLEAIRVNVYNAGDGKVRSAAIEENVTTNDNTGSGGLPPKSFRVFVLAPDTTTVDDYIAQEIYETRSAGIRSYGSDSGSADVTGGGTKVEEFSRATKVTIHIDVDIVVNDEFPADGKERIKQRLITYIGGELPSGNRAFGQSMGNDIIYDQVFAAVMNGNGIIERGSSDITIGTSDDPTGTSDITIGDSEVGQVVPSRIDITTTEGTVS